MRLEYDSDKFSQILDSYAKNLNALGDETKPGVLLIVANSYRQMANTRKRWKFIINLSVSIRHS